VNPFTIRGGVPFRDRVIIAAALVLSALGAGLVVQRPDLFNLTGVASPGGFALLLAGLVLGAVCLRFPDVALCCLVAFVYLNLSDVLVRSHGLPSLLQLSFVPLALAGWWSAAPGRRLHSHGLLLLLIGYLVIVLCSTTSAADAAAADLRLLEHLRGFAIFVVMVLLARSAASMRLGAWTLVACAAVLGGLALVHVLTGDFTRNLGGLARVKYAHIHGTTFEPRIAGPLGDPNFFAQLLIVAVPFALFLAWTEYDIRRRALAFCAAGLAMAATVFTYSRGGALALFAVLLLSMLARGISVRAIALGAVPVLALLWIALPDEFAQRLATLGQLLPGSEGVLRPDSSFGERRLFTAAAWRMFEDSPLLGVGAGNYGFHFLEYAQQVGSEARVYVTPTEGYYPHNLYLEVAAETGVIGLAVFGLALAACFAYLWHARVRLLAAGDLSTAALATACSIGLCGYLVSSLFLHGHFIRYWWLIAGFAAAFHNVAAGTHSARRQHAPIESTTAARVRLAADRGLEPDTAREHPAGPPEVRPSVAVLLSRFPLITETFILREIIEMERQGQPVLLVPLLKETPAVVHREAMPWTKQALYTPFLSADIVRANLRMMRRRPCQYVATLWRIGMGTVASPDFFIRSLALFPKAVFLAERLEREGIRHLHAHYATHPATVALIASALTGMTFSFTVHAHDIFVRRSLLRWKLEAASFVRAISQFNREFLARRYPAALVRKVQVIHVGINPAIYGGAPEETSLRDHPAPTQRRVLCVASLQPYKGIPVLLDACSLLRQRGVDFTCTIVGEGPMRPALEAQIRRLDLQHVVTLAGARPQHEVAALLRSASLLVMPSIVAPDGQMEGIPVAIMEAMAARLPVVASSLSGIPEAVGHGSTGFLVEPGRPSELALAIERVFSDEGATRRMGDAGRAAIEQEFRLDLCVSALLRLIDRHNPLPDGSEMVRRPALGAGFRSGPIGLRRLQERRDSRIAQVIVPNGAAPHELVLKTHKSRPGESRPAVERARREFEILRTLSRAPVNGSGVPRPLYLDADDACVVMEACSGEPLDVLIRGCRLARDRSVQADLVSAVRRAGRWLRHFQEPGAETGSPVPALNRLVETAREHLDRCRGELPASTGSAVRAQLDGLKTRLAPASLRLTRVHCDFWPGNIFVDDDVVEVIDFEGATEGLPYEDVAYFLVQLELFFPGPVLHRRFNSLAGGFLAGYLPADHGFDWAAYELCRIGSALQILGSTPYPAHSLPDRWRRRTLRAIIVGGAA
jgi:glycosyltransferase involved in cell wall biosynthesis/O-antigen ligase/aminoglycoside phosphotransferase (APT) family kinase protein